MKKIIIGVVIALVFIAGGVGLYLIYKADPNTTTNSSTSSTNSGISKAILGPVDACSVLTEDIAESLLGDNVNKGSTPSTGITTASIGVSNCSYIKQVSDTKTGSDEPKLSGANLLVQYAKDADGAKTNKDQFMSALPTSEVQEVKDIGDKAFYNPQFHQLHVLKGSNWYIVTYYKNSVLNSTLESDTELAKKLQFK